MSGYHIREAGATALQELAFTLRDGIEYVQWGVDAGLDVDAFVPQHLVLLQRAQRLLRGDRQVPRRAEDLGARRCATASARRDERSWKLRFHTPDRRRVAHRAAAVQQRRADGAPGAVGGARRHQLAAHQLARRGAGAADRRGGDAGAAHAADHRPRKRRRQRRRSARRVVLRREADAGHGRRRAYAYFDAIDRMGGMVAAIEQRLPAAGDRRERHTASSRRSSAAKRSWSASTRSSRRTSRRSQILYIDDIGGGHAAGEARDPPQDARPRRRAAIARAPRRRGAHRPKT